MVLKRWVSAWIVASLFAGLAFLPGLAAADPPQEQYYLSVGDSYATGYQPGGMTTEGFANQIVPKARHKGYNLNLVNVGCAGATTTSILVQKGCPKDRLAIGAKGYGRLTQAQAAARFLRHHRGEVALVTVSIGGNDVTACAEAEDAITCVAEAATSIERNVGRLVRKLRRAGGSKVTIVGTTYPDVLLGQWVRKPVNKSIAELSVVAFKSIINPALSSQYLSVGGKFADVTAATGAYRPLDRYTTLPPYGRIPKPVARVCKLTWYCQKGDIHARDHGYGIIAGLVVDEMSRFQ